MSWKEFIEAVTQTKTEIEFPHLAAVCLAQAIMESGRESSDLARLHNNHHGMKWRPEMSDVAEKVYYETDTEPGGGDWFCKFANKVDAVYGYWRFLERSPYDGWRNHVNTPTEFLAFISPIWCPPGYEDSWKTQHDGLVYHEYIMQNLYDEACELPEEQSTDTGRKTLWIPFAEKPLQMHTSWTYENGYPHGAVVHFTAGRNNPIGTMQFLNEKHFPCLIMDRDGEIYQGFPLNRGGCHSGTKHHEDSVGIEMIAAGRCEAVTVNGKRKFKAWFHRTPDEYFNESEVRYVTRDGSRQEGWYHKYTPAQEESLIKLLLWLKSQAPDVFSFDHVKGHDECCDEAGKHGNKNDPGGALSMTMPKLRTLLKQKYAESLQVPYTVVVNDANPPLNVRSGPGTNYSIVGTLNNGTSLTVEENNGTDWLRISTPISGWVAKYLTKRTMVADLRNYTTTSV